MAYYMTTEKIPNVTFSSMVTFAGSCIYFYELYEVADVMYIGLNFTLIDFNSTWDSSPLASNNIYDLKTKNMYERVLTIWQENAAMISFS